jgi:hypothetical protein
VIIAIRLQVIEAKSHRCRPLDMVAIPDVARLAFFSICEHF